MNNKGADKILSVYWFAVLIIIAGGIIAMVTIFYGYPADIREVESNVMVNKVSNCLSPIGELNSNVFLEDFSLKDECSLTFETEKTFGENEQYYVEINFYNESGNVLKLSEGNINYLADCRIESENYNRLVRCVNRTFYSTSSQKLYEINVLSIVAKSEKNVQ